MICFLLVIFFININLYNDIIAQNYNDKLTIFKKSLFVVISSPIEVPQVKIDASNGTGIIFIYNEEIWGLSCRHVIEPLIGKSLIKFFSKIKDKNSGKLNGLFINFNQTKNIWFHPDDNENKTRDIVLLYYGKISEISKEYKFFELPKLIDFPILNEKDTLLVLGYPGKKLSYNLFYENDKPMPLSIIQGEYISYITNFKPTNSENIALDQYYIVVENSKGLRGMSGSLVLVKKGTSYYPIGLISIAGNFNFINLVSPDTTNINYLSFTHFKYLYGLLKNFK